MQKSKILNGLFLLFFLISFCGLSVWAETPGRTVKTEVEVDLPPSPAASATKVSAKDFSLSGKAKDAEIINLNVKPKRVDNPPKYYRDLNLTRSGRKNSGSALFTASLVSLAALNVADYLSTCKALKYPGLREGNPLMKSVTKNALVFAGVKLGVTVCDYLILKKIYKKNKTLGWVLTTAANIAMSYVVANNMKMIHQAQRGL